MAIKEVRFDIYCSKCKHSDKTESEDPCWDCLNQGWNIDSHKPEFFEEKEVENGNTGARKVRKDAQVDTSVSAEGQLETSPSVSTESVHTETESKDSTID